MYPGVEYSKHDVRGALRLIWIRFEDIFIIVVEIRGGQLGQPGKVVSIISLALPFEVGGAFG